MDTEYFVTDLEVIIVSMLIAFTLLGVFFFFYARILIPFKRRTNYIKMEMRRSDGEELQYWKNALKRHYITNIPFVGKHIWRIVRKCRENE